MKLAVVVVAGEDTETVRQCLDALHAMPEWAQIECVVVQRGNDSPGVARARGWRETSGDVVAFLNDRYRVSRGWARAILAAHERSNAVVIGGCVAAPGNKSAGAHAIFLWEYAQVACPRFEGPLERAEALALPGGNTSYKRAAFAVKTLSQSFWELDFHRSLWDRGTEFRRAAEMEVAYAPPSVREFLRERYWLSRDWARARAAGMRPLRRFAAGIARVALPVLLLYRNVRRGFSVPGPLRRRLACLAFFFSFALVETCGELAGWFRAPRASPDRRA